MTVFTSVRLLGFTLEKGYGLLKNILFFLRVFKGVRSRSLPKCDISCRIDKFTLNPTVPFFMPKAVQNFELFDSLCTGSYEGECKKMALMMNKKKKLSLRQNNYIHSKEELLLFWMVCCKTVKAWQKMKILRYLCSKTCDFLLRNLKCINTCIHIDRSIE